MSSVELLEGHRIALLSKLRDDAIARLIDREDLVARAEEVLDWVREEKLQVRIAAELPLAQAAEAHRLLESRRSAGKVLLIP